MSKERTTVGAPPGAARAVIPCTDPATGESLGEAPVYREEQVRQVMKEEYEQHTGFSITVE